MKAIRKTILSIINAGDVEAESLCSLLSDPLGTVTYLNEFSTVGIWRKRCLHGMSACSGIRNITDLN